MHQIQDSTIQKVLFISSTSVYPSHNKIMTEEDEVNSNNPLVAIEHLFRENTFLKLLYCVSQVYLVMEDILQTGLKMVVKYHNQKDLLI